MYQGNGLSSRDALIGEYGVDETLYKTFENKQGASFALDRKNHITSGAEKSILLRYIESVRRQLNGVENAVVERYGTDMLKIFRRLYFERNPTWVPQEQHVEEPAYVGGERIAAPLDGNDEELERWKDEARRSRIEG